jgi:hypothetical protein
VRFVTAVLILVLTAGCVARTGQLPDNAVLVAPKTAVVMPSPAALDRSVEAVQLISAHYGGQTYVFESRISVTPERLRLVSVDSLGREAMKIVWTSGGIYYEAAPWVPEQLRPENVLADIIILYWPEATVQSALIGGSLRLADGHRTVVADGRDVIRADFKPQQSGDPWSGTLHYENLAWGYALDIQSKEAE